MAYYYLHLTNDTSHKTFLDISFDSWNSHCDADIEPLQNNLALEEGLCKALLCRLRFRKVLTLFALFITN